MHRAQVILEEWQYQALRSLAERKGRSVSELLRDILTKHLRPRPSKKGLSAIEGIVSDPTVRGDAHDEVLYGLPER